jgi:5-methylcytosine-specific restriction enzyme A
MPDRPLRPCAQPGCPALVRMGRCEKHARLREQERGSSTERGYDGAWRAYSERFRAEFPLCGDRPPEARETQDSVCRQAGRVEAAALVDHIVPIAGPGDARFYDRSNHQSLCQDCHNLKRQRESMPGGGRGPRR